MNKKSNPMNVAILGSFPPLRGISSYCFELAQSLASAACRVEFISFKSMYPTFLYPGGDLKDDNTFPESRNSHLKVQRNIAWYNPLGWIVAGLRNKADLLHAQWWSLPLAPVYLCLSIISKMRGKPVVFTIHNVLAHERSPLFFHISKRLFSMGDHFIVHSALNRRQLIEFYDIPDSRISLIPHGPLGFQVNADADPTTIRAELDFRPEHKVVLLFGAIRSYKGVDTTIAAFSQVAAQVPEARLLIVGKPWQSWRPYEAMIQRYGIQNQVTVRLGYVPSADVHRYFCACDLVILPYHHFDSQSGVGGTAVSFRKPLIVTRVGGLPDLVLHQHAIVPPIDPPALADAIVTCFKDPALLMQLAKDADTIARMISWTGIARQTIEVYTKLIKNDSQSGQRKQEIPVELL